MSKIIVTSEIGEVIINSQIEPSIEVDEYLAAKYQLPRRYKSEINLRYDLHRRFPNWTVEYIKN